MRREDLQLELQGLRQEPYSIYYRLAHRDRGLRFELRENGTVLMVFDQDERPLRYFFRAGDGSVIGWGNYYNGRINQNYYGPVADMGDVRLPRWGAATDGRFRFEYLRATVDDRPLTTP